MDNIKNKIDKYNLFLNEIEQAYDSKDFRNEKILFFWQSLVRDSDGRWLNHHFDANKYFKYGLQVSLNPENPMDLSLFRSGLLQHRKFINGILNLKKNNFFEWLKALHEEQSYLKESIKIVKKRRYALGIHGTIVDQSFIPMVKKYQDSYKKNKKNVLYLKGIPDSALPYDIWNKNEILNHFYPDPSSYKLFLDILEKKLIKIINSTKENEFFENLASYYQYGINMHLFESINQSLFANQINALLMLNGFKPINHGILDFVALRMQPENFIKYFTDEILYAQKTLKEKRKLLSKEQLKYLNIFIETNLR